MQLTAKFTFLATALVYGSSVLALPLVPREYDIEARNVADEVSYVARDVPELSLDARSFFDYEELDARDAPSTPAAPATPAPGTPATPATPATPSTPTTPKDGDSTPKSGASDKELSKSDAAPHAHPKAGDKKLLASLIADMKLPAGLKLSAKESKNVALVAALSDRKNPHHKSAIHRLKLDKALADADPKDPLYEEAQKRAALKKALQDPTDPLYAKARKIHRRKMLRALHDPTDPLHKKARKWQNARFAKALANGEKDPLYKKAVKHHKFQLALANESDPNHAKALKVAAKRHAFRKALLDSSNPHHKAALRKLRHRMRKHHALLRKHKLALMEQSEGGASSHLRRQGGHSLHKHRLDDNDSSKTDPSKSGSTPAEAPVDKKASADAAPSKAAPAAAQ